jgi:predicted dehydrogenase
MANAASSRQGTAQVRIAVVGCGTIARAVHIPTLARMPGGRVVALVDPSPDALRLAGPLAPSARALPSIETLLAADDPALATDAIVSCVPSPVQATVAATVLEAGRHAYVEKPVATSADAARRLLAAWRTAQRVGVVGFNYRQHPLVRQARALLAAGAIGDVVGVQTLFTSRPPIIPDWKQGTASGGALFDKGSHHVDLLVHLLGTMPETVAATVGARRAPGDTATITCRFPGGVVLQGLFSFDAATDDRVTIVGQRGRLVIDRLAGLTVEQTGGPVDRAALRRLLAMARAIAREPFARTRLLRPDAEPSFHAALSLFVQGVRQWPAPLPGLPDLADGVRCLSVLLAAREAAESGRTVAVRDLAA